MGAAPDRCGEEGAEPGAKNRAASRASRGSVLVHGFAASEGTLISASPAI